MTPQSNTLSTEVFGAQPDLGSPVGYAVVDEIRSVLAQFGARPEEVVQCVDRFQHLSALAREGEALQPGVRDDLSALRLACSADRLTRIFTEHRKSCAAELALLQERHQRTVSSAMLGV